MTGSTPRQILLYRALGLADQIPRYAHLPLVVGQDGRRLAKRHGDTRLSHYREAGVPAGRVLSLLARWCGVDVVDDSLTARQLIDRISLQTLPKSRIVFTAADDAFLREGRTPA
jgi:glutamyl-tRNA synthetase